MHIGYPIKKSNKTFSNQTCQFILHDTNSIWPSPLPSSAPVKPWHFFDKDREVKDLRGREEGSLSLVLGLGSENIPIKPP